MREGLKNTSTVGAVAIDANGLIVAGTSTGGIPQKLPGRIGDAAIFGAGTYADAHVAASATGFGEDIIRLGATRMFGQVMLWLSLLMSSRAYTLLASSLA